MIKNFRQFLFIAGLLMIAAGAQPSIAAFYQWSTTAATNATADPSINWSEGQSPSSINDSARAMMSVLAVRGKDQGQLTGSGTTSAIVITTNTGYPNIAALNGQILTFQHSLGGGNDAGATLNIDGIGALPLYSGVSPIAAGVLEDRGVYSVICYSSNSRCYLIDNHPNPYNIPLGSLLWSTLPTPPNANFVAPSGQCISTTTYATYWVALGSPASGACPGGQFAIIDLRGRVVAALDTLNASAANRLTSAGTGCGTAMTSVGAVCANGAESHVQSLAELATHSHSIVDPGHQHGLNTGPSSKVLDSGTVGSFAFTGGSSAAPNLAINTATTGISVNNAGSATAAPQVQPTIALVPFLRVL